MKKISFTLIIVIFLTANIKMCFADEASAYKRCSATKPKINLSTSFGKLEYDYTQSIENLSEYYYSRIKSGENINNIAGLTVAKYSANLELSAYPIRSGEGYCITPQKIDVFIGIKTPKIYVAKHLKPGTCQYNLVLRHEQAHAQIAISTLEHLVTSMPSALKTVSKDIKPIYVKSERGFEKAQKQLFDEYWYVINDFIRQLNEAKDKEDSKLDNPKNQEFESSICKGSFY